MCQQDVTSQKVSPAVAASLPVRALLRVCERSVQDFIQLEFNLSDDVGFDLLFHEHNDVMRQDRCELTTTLSHMAASHLNLVSPRCHFPHIIEIIVCR